MAGEEIVGGIKGYLTLDADQFHREIARVIAEVKLLDGKNVDIKVDTHGDKVSRDLGKIARGADNAGQSVQKLGTSFASGGMRSGPVVIGAVAAGMALIGPTVGAATAALGGFVGVAGGAVLAWRGFSAEIEKGTILGLALKGELDGLSDSMGELQRTSAANASGGVLAGLEHVRTWLPSLNDDVARLSARLGSAFNISTEAFTSGLDAMMPLLQDGGVYAEKFATALRNGAQSQEFRTFVEYARQQLPAFIELVSSLTSGFVTLATALAPLGEVAVANLTLTGKSITWAGKAFEFANTKLNPLVVGMNLLGGSSKVAASGTDAATAAVGALIPAVSAQAAALGTTTIALQAARDAQASQATAAADATLKMQLENNAAGLLKQALDGLNGTSLSAAQAQNQFDSALANMGDHVNKTGKKITFTTTSITNMSSASVALRGQLLGQVTAAEQTAGAYGQMQGSAEAGRTKLIALREQIINNAVAHGVDRAAVTAYIDTVLKVPKKVPPTLLQVNKAQALKDIATFQARIDAIHGKYVEIGVRYVVSGSLPNGSRSTAGGQTVDANGSIKFYANGGINGGENHVAQIAPAGANRMWAEPETGGEAYIPLARTKRARSEKILAETNKLMGNPLGAGTVELSMASLQALAAVMSRVQLATTVSAGQFDYAIGAAR